MHLGAMHLEAERRADPQDRIDLDAIGSKGQRARTLYRQPMASEDQAVDRRSVEERPRLRCRLRGPTGNTDRRGSGHRQCLLRGNSGLDQAASQEGSIELADRSLGSSHDQAGRHWKNRTTDARVVPQGMRPRDASSGLLGTACQRPLGVRVRSVCRRARVVGSIELVERLASLGETLASASCSRVSAASETGLCEFEFECRFAEGSGH